MVTIYQFKEGINVIAFVICSALIFTIINLITALIIGIRKKDLAIVTVTNIMVKTVISVIIVPIILLNKNGIWSLIISFPIVALVEGFIYKKKLKYDRHNGLDVAFICNFTWIFLALCLTPVLLIIASFL